MLNFIYYNQLSVSRVNWWSSTPSALAPLTVAQSISQKRLSQGSTCELLEAKLSKLIGSEHTLMAPSGSMALLLGMTALGVQPGDEVIVPNFTWIATANVAKMLGANVVIADICQDTFCIDPNSVASLITEKTKLIVPVALNGYCPDLESIYNIIKRTGHSIPILLDACQAFGTDLFRSYSKYIEAAAYSFAVTKIVTCGQGGALCTNNLEMFQKATLIKNNGCSSVSYPDYQMPGINLKFTDILSSLLISNLDHLSSNIHKVKALHSLYISLFSGFDGIDIMPMPINSFSIYVFAKFHSSSLKNKFLSLMLESSIEIRPFPPGLSTSNYFTSRSSLEGSNKLAQSIIYLPSGPAQKLNRIRSLFTSSLQRL